MFIKLDYSKVLNYKLLLLNMLRALDMVEFWTVIE